MQEKPLLTEEELNLLTNKEVFIIKNKVTHKLQELFASLNIEMEKEKALFSDKLPAEVIATKGKVSRGENYSGYPWMLLDNPRLFNKNDVFAFRSMCWWGHEFSFTLHLSGIYLEKPHTHLKERLHSIKENNIYICVNDSPWSYHFEEGNYQPLHAATKLDAIISKDFIKLSRRLKIEDVSALNQCATETFQLFMNTLL